MVKTVKKDEFMGIEGFTNEFENHLKLTKVSADHKLNASEIKETFTYSYATLALTNNSPVQLINVINSIKSRYGKKYLNNEAMGFLDCMVAKAYGYISLTTKNMETQTKCRKMAISIFEKAYSKGYVQALNDLMDFKSKWSSEPYRIEDIGLAHVKENMNILYSIGNLFVSFPTLVENASRVLKNKRPVIENKQYFEMGEYRYKQGANDSASCAVCLGLCYIINDKKEDGLKLIQKNISRFKSENENAQRFLFESDAFEIKNAIEKIEKNILINVRR